MQARAIATLLPLLFTGCGPTIHGYPFRESRPAESQQVGETLDPLLRALSLPSLREITASSDCKIGFAIVRTDKVNVWSAPPTTSPCLYFTLLITEGALKIPSDQLMATIAHELGHVVLRHTPQSDRPQPSVSAEEWRAIHAQELAADRFAVDLLKRTRALYHIGACDAVARFLRRGIPDWYGITISTRMHEALTQRVESADAACASPDVTSLPRVAPTAPSSSVP
jgi:hypothetical protein